MRNYLPSQSCKKRQFSHFNSYCTAWLDAVKSIAMVKYFVVKSLIDSEGHIYD